MTAPKAVFIKTYGCQMNAYDSERMGDVLAGSVTSGPRISRPPISSCSTPATSVKKRQKVYSELGKLKRLKQRNGDLVIAVAGCVAQAEGEETVHVRAPAVDLVFGPRPTTGSHPTSTRSEPAAPSWRQVPRRGEIRQAG